MQVYTFMKHIPEVSLSRQSQLVKQKTTPEDAGNSDWQNAGSRTKKHPQKIKFCDIFNDSRVTSCQLFVACTH